MKNNDNERNVNTMTAKINAEEIKNPWKITSEDLELYLWRRAELVGMIYERNALAGSVTAVRYDSDGTHGTEPGDPTARKVARMDELDAKIAEREKKLLHTLDYINSIPYPITRYTIIRHYCFGETYKDIAEDIAKVGKGLTPDALRKRANTFEKMYLIKRIDA